MSDSVRCDVCGDRGQRRSFKAAPDGWHYSEVVDEETRAVSIVYACSRECMGKFWKRGPGDLRGGKRDDESA
jgi:hypothetical protein